jgi:hypothetical protein
MFTKVSFFKDRRKSHGSLLLPPTKSLQKTPFSTAQGTLGGAVVLSLELPAQSTVADLEERMVTALGDGWKNASFWLGEHQAQVLKQLQPCGLFFVAGYVLIYIADEFS